MSWYASPAVAALSRFFKKKKISVYLMLRQGLCGFLDNERVGLAPMSFCVQRGQYIFVF